MIDFQWKTAVRTLTQTSGGRVDKNKSKNALKTTGERTPKHLALERLLNTSRLSGLVRPLAGNRLFVESKRPFLPQSSLEKVGGGGRRPLPFPRPRGRPDPQDRRFPIPQKTGPLSRHCHNPTPVGHRSESRCTSQAGTASSCHTLRPRCQEFGQCACGPMPN